MNTAKTNNRILPWFRPLRRSSQITLVFVLLVSIGVVAYAESILWNSDHTTTSLSKDWYIEVENSGGEVSGSIRPGGIVNISPTVVNKGDITYYAFLHLSIPLVNREPAYDFTADGSWT